MLNSQTTEVVVSAALRERQRDEVATLAVLAKKRSAALIPYLYKCSFYNNETRYILETVWILQESYRGDIPKTAAEMMKLPGVGPRMAYICENVAWGTQSGIGIDRHMYRVFKKLGFVPHHCKSPEQARVQLQSWLPHEHWGEAYNVWVGFSQEVQQEKAKIFRKALLFSRPRVALLLLQRCGLFHPSILAHFDTADMVQAAAILQNGSDDENEK
jgi:endonuclease III